MSDDPTKISIATRFSLDAVRTERAMPDYRLAKRGGELVLQRAFLWEKGSTGGHEWRDVPMALEEDGDAEK